MMLYSRWRRAVVFAGINVLLIGAVALLVVAPAIDLLNDQAQRIGESRMSLARSQALLARKDMIRNLETESTERLAKDFIQGDSPNRLNADLINRLRAHAEGHGLSFNSVTALPHQDWNSRRYVGARLELIAQTQPLAEMLSKIEKGSPFLFVRHSKLSITGDAQQTDDLVTATLDVYGATRWPGR